MKKNPTEIYYFFGVESSYQLTASFQNVADNSKPLQELQLTLRDIEFLLPVLTTIMQESCTEARANEAIKEAFQSMEVGEKGAEFYISRDVIDIIKLAATSAKEDVSNLFEILWFQKSQLNAGAAFLRELEPKATL